MKKIIFLFIFILIFTTGCFDYIELNNLSIVSGIGIDYTEDKKVKVTFEILNDQKNSENGKLQKSFTISGIGKNIASAIDDASRKTPKLAYYSHLRLLILSKDIATIEAKSGIDYFLRSPNIRNEFKVVIANNVSAQKILENSSDKSPVVSEQIEKMLENNKFRKNNASPYDFEQIVANFLEKGKDASITTLDLLDDEIAISGLALFSGFKIKDILSNQESGTYNILLNNVGNVEYVLKCDNNNDNNITLSVYDANTNIKIKNSKVIINIKLFSSIIEYTCKENLKEPKSYVYFQKKYEPYFEEIITNFYQKSRKNKSDILYINKKYYNKYRQVNNNTWLNLDYEIKTELHIYKDGLLFEVKNDN